MSFLNAIISLSAERAELEVKTPHPRVRGAPPRPADFSKVTIREGYSGAERRKKILRYFCLREARGGAGRVFSPRGGAGRGKSFGLSYSSAPNTLVLYIR